MSRVEENVDAIKAMNAMVENIGSEGMIGLIIHKPELVSAIVSSSQLDMVVDISRSLAVIADSLSYIVKEEAQVRKERVKKWKDKVMPSYRSMHPFLVDVESRFKASGITSEEWETWVGLRDKYLYDKKESEE